MEIFKTKKIILFLVLLSILGCKENKPASEDDELSQQWYKGNLHTHSYWSDGDEFPEVIVDWYKSEGYQFIALSDHNTVAKEEKWITISEDSIYQKAFQRYLEKYGTDWVIHKIDSGRPMVRLKTYDEYKNRSEEVDKFLVIPSEEITDEFEGKPLHMNATNIQTKIEPQGGSSVSQALQNNIDQVLKQRQETGIPIMPHVNHPNFGYAIHLNDMISLNGERFFEVYNGHPMVHNMGDSTRVSTEEMWDLINISYLENKKPIMYGLATDDSHHYHKSGNEWSNAGRGWVMVQADSLSASSLITALEAGNFYSSTGITLKSITRENNRLFIEIDQEKGVEYTLTFIGLRNGKSETEELISVKGNQADFEMTEDIVFARCRITSSKLQSNPIERILYEMAWTQPVIRDAQ
ncbi:PHP domain-containing protein [Maribacter sp. 2307UL18-2]|uniref:PHP domain-containing protein n=1 Tax=Maribacter sp. 2307UL18-2 TaxID=3386274 RepID=UPI0039BD2006